MKQTLALAGVLAIMLAVVPAAAPRAQRACHRPTAHDLYTRLPREYPRFKRALVMYFGRSWKDAAVVSYGEGSWHKDAENGQYLGTFQMGSRERARYGHGPDLVSQTRAASRYWSESGWSPWDCRP